MADWGLPAAAPAQEEGGWVPDTNFRSSPSKAKEDSAEGDFAAQDNGDDGNTTLENATGDSDERLCFRCNQPGHQKSECTNDPVEREFIGECHFCQGPHRARECPEKVCTICDEKGHAPIECKANRVLLKVEEMDADKAWDMFADADKEKDIDDLKDCMLLYCKACPEMTFVDIEQALRQNDMSTYLVAMEKEISTSHTLINLQGLIDQKFLVTFQFSAKPRRARQLSGWPEDTEQNLERLKEAGFIFERIIPPGERTKNERASEVARECVYCGAGDHVTRHCPNPRPTGRKEPECRNCGQVGHMSKDCTEEKNMDNVKCKNCDQLGHFSKECSLPTDWSRVQCTKCQEFGHSFKKCTQPVAEATDDGDGGW